MTHVASEWNWRIPEHTYCYTPILHSTYLPSMIQAISVSESSDGWFGYCWTVPFSRHMILKFLSSFHYWWLDPLILYVSSERRISARFQRHLFLISNKTLIENTCNFISHWWPSMLSKYIQLVPPLCVFC